MQFKNCKLVVKLKAQSPMVHFQGNEAGATIRGSEFKPKFDKFLWNKAEREKLPLGAYMNREKHALNYKVKFEEAGKKDRINLKDDDYKKEFMFLFGDRKKTLIFCDVDLTIICMNQPLQEMIEKYLIEFFAVTNFGFRQDKGFGSFMPEEYLNQKDESKLLQEVSRYLKENCQACKCYYMDFSKRTPENIKGFVPVFRQMKDFYDVLKTGRNFKGEYARAYVYQYMHEKGIDNEKAWLKANKIAPVLGKKTGSGNKNPDSRYVRALLGLGSHVEYLNSPDSRKEKVSVSIQDVDSDIERMASPVLFKVINGYVFICADRIPEQIYQKTFRFSSKVKKTQDFWENHAEIILKEGKEGTIRVPSEEELKQVVFSIDDFLEKYVQYYNNEIEGESGKLRETVLSLNRNVKVNTVEDTI